MQTTPSNPPRVQPTAPRRRGKWIGAVIAMLVLALVAAAAWYLIRRNSQPNGMFMRGGMASTVGVAKAEALDIPVTVEALGTVTPLATVTVRPQVSGVITAINFLEGQLVRKGELLAQIEPRPFDNALQEAQGNLKRDEAQLADARLQLERNRTLLEQDSIAQQDVDTQAATVRQLEGTVAADRAAVDTARLNVEFSRITAPVAGRVGLRLVDQGNYIGAGDATGIAVITQITPIDVRFTVPQDLVAEIQRYAGQGKLVATALDRTRTTVLATGEFLTLDNQVDTTTGTVGGKARFTNTDGALFPNQFVNLRIQLYTIAQAVAVPLSAVRNGAQGDIVYTLNDDRTVSVRKVARGAQTADRVQITQGLKIGETVVTEGSDRLEDGATVQLPGESGLQQNNAAPRDGQRRRGGERGERGERGQRGQRGDGNAPPRGPGGGGPGGGPGGPPGAA